MKPVEINLERTRGDTAPIEFTLSTTKNKKKTPIDITGNTFILSVSAQESPTGSVYVFQSTGAILDPLAGTITFPISTLNANNLGQQFYDVQMTAGTIISTIIKGVLDFGQDITK